jgi:hypothetical protein
MYPDTPPGVGGMRRTVWLAFSNIETIALAMPPLHKTSHQYQCSNACSSELTDASGGASTWPYDALWRCIEVGVGFGKWSVGR